MLALPAELTHQQASACLAKLLQALRAPESAKPKQLVLDATPLARFDSAALAVLLECQRQAAASGTRFSIQGLPERLADLARLYGVLDLLGVEQAAAGEMADKA